MLIAAGVMFVIEFFADKIPYLDNVWDAIHTVVRPLGAAALGFVIAGDSSSIGEAVGGLVAGAFAVTSHTAKATTRAAVNVSPEPVSNIALSVLEDGLASGVMLLALAFPVAALIVVTVLAVAAVWLTTRLWKAVGRLFRGRRARAGSKALGGDSR